jgi:hypothetical protein
MNLERAIKSAYKKKADRGHAKLFWAIDLHGTIIPSSYSSSEIFSFYPGAKECLNLISSFTDHSIILYTCSYNEKMAPVVAWMKEKGIRIDYMNENPECKNTEMSDFSKKMYFDILIDDKAGFEPETDWIELNNILRGMI